MFIRNFCKQRIRIFTTRFTGLHRHWFDRYLGWRHCSFVPSRQAVFPGERGRRGPTGSRPGTRAPRPASPAPPPGGAAHSRRPAGGAAGWRWTWWSSRCSSRPSVWASSRADPPSINKYRICAREYVKWRYFNSSKKKQYPGPGQSRNKRAEAVWLIVAAESFPSVQKGGSPPPYGQVDYLNN